MQGDGESITYNAFNKPLHIAGGAGSSDFSYGADLMRYKQVTPSGSTILYIDKLMEIETQGISKPGKLSAGVSELQSQQAT